MTFEGLFQAKQFYDLIILWFYNIRKCCQKCRGFSTSAHLFFFWLSETTLLWLISAWKCSLSLHQGPLFCSPVTSSLCPSSAQPKVLLPNLLLFQIALATSYLLIPSDSQSHLHQVHQVPMFSLTLTAVYTPLLYLVLTALVQPQKPFLALPFGFSFMPLARPCSCCSSCSHQFCSLPQYVALLRPVSSLGTVRGASSTAAGTLKTFIFQRLDPSCSMCFFQI